MKQITDTEIKLSDAAVQMKLALEKIDSEPAFRSCINAYISAARSVTMVMQKESSAIPELRVWYKQQTAELGEIPVAKFFASQRTHSIHKASVPVRSQSAEISNLSINGGEPSKTTGIFTWWTFYGVQKFIPNSSGNVIRLCDEYFRLLRSLVAAWLYQLATYSDEA